MDQEDQVTEAGAGPVAKVKMTLLQRIGVWFLVLGGAFYLAQKLGLITGAGSTYQDRCKEIVSKDEVFQKFRLTFTKQGSGEVYEIGQPNRTLGHYTKYLLRAGQGDFRLTCFSDTQGSFIRAEETSGIGTLCHYPNGTKQVCWETK